MKCKAIGPSVVTTIVVSMMVLSTMVPTDHGFDHHQECVEVGPVSREPRSPEVVHLQARLGDSFIENRGQAGPGAGLLYATGDRFSVAFGTGWVAYDFRGGGGRGGCLVRVRFASANLVEPQGVDPLDFPTHFIRSGSLGTVTGVRSFSGVLYQDLWDGIDLRFCRRDGMLKYTYILDPGADPSEVRMEYEGVLGLRVEAGTGDLLVDTGVGTFSDSAPVAFQGKGVHRVNVGVGFRLDGGGSVGFSVGPYDRGLPLTIDPGLEFCTYHGGSDLDAARNIAVCDDGSLYFTGQTRSADFPTTSGAYCETSHKEQFSFYIAKFNHNASQLLFCTFIDGSEGTGFSINDIKADPEGSAWMVGVTNSSAFPVTQDAYSTTLSGEMDGYLLRLNPSGTEVMYGTYIGGSEGDICSELSLVSTGEAIICGRTYSSDFPTTSSAFSSSINGISDIFLLRLNTTTRTLLYSTYVGGSDTDTPFGLDVDAVGNAYVVARYSEDDFPTTPGAFSRTSNGRDDAVVFKMDNNGSKLLFGTYVGGSEYDTGFCPKVDEDGSVWFLGDTNSKDYPTTGDALDAEFDGESYESFLTHVSSDGSALLYSSFVSVGPGTSDSLTSMSLGGPGRPYVCGYTASVRASFPHSAISNASGGNIEAFVMWLDTVEGRILNGTFVGGAAPDFAGEMVATSNRSVVMTGYAESANLPVTDGCHQGTNRGSFDCFLAGLSMGETPWSLPSAPRNLTATPHDMGVELRWDPPSHDSDWPVERYLVYMGSEQGCETYVDETLGECSIRLHRLVNGRTYYFRVSAETVVGEGPPTPSLAAVPRRSPGAPSDLAASPGCGTVRLEWSPPQDTGGAPVLGYHVFRGLSDSNLSLLADVGNVTEFIDTTPLVGVPYHYRVRAYNVAGNGKFSTTVVAVPRGLPGPPTYLFALPGDGTVRLIWKPPENEGGLPIKGYVLSRGPSEDSLSELVKVGTVEEYVDDDVQNGMNYYYSVSAENDMGTGPPAPTVKATPRGAPGPPVGLSAAGEDGRVLLSWDPPGSDGGAPLLAYRVFRSEAMEDLSFLTEVNGSTTLTDLDVRNGRTYFYSVSATNELGEGARSPVASATPAGPAGPVLNLTVEAGAGTVVLGWEPPEDTGGSPVVAVRVYTGISPLDLSPLPDLSPSATWAEVSCPVNGVTYYFAVAVVTELGEGVLSGTVSGTPVGPPGAPRDLVATGGDGVVTLSWLPPEDDGGAAIMGYRVLRGEGGGDLEVVATLGNVTDYVDSGVVNGRTYDYLVVAFNPLLNGSASGTLHATPAGPPGAPLNLTVEEEDGRIKLTWSMPLEDGGLPVINFIVLRGRSPDSLERIDEVGTSLEYTDGDVERGARYHYRVLAENGVGTGEPSAVVDIELGQGPGEEADSMTPYLLVGVAALVAIIVSYAILFRLRKEETNQ